MLGVSFGAAALFRPFWIGAAGAVVATTAERYRARVFRFRDDNLIIVASSLTLMLILTRLTS